MRLLIKDIPNSILCIVTFINNNGDSSTIYLPKNLSDELRGMSGNELRDLSERNNEDVDSNI